MAALSPNERADESLARWWSPNSRVDGASIGAFRVGFGLLLLWEVWRYVNAGWITSLYVAPSFHFKWPGFEWVHPWPGAGMHVHFLVLAIAAGCLALGYAYRIAAIISWLGWTYVFLLDRSLYLNHVYLVCLMALLLVLVPADRSLRIDGGRGDGARDTSVPVWCLWLLRFQIAIPYVYGGIAKLNGDFLRGRPLETWMAGMESLAWIPGMGSRELAISTAYIATLFDLLVVPALLWRRTRLVAFALAIAFHLANAVMWRIGIFPWMMIAATTLFLAPDWPRRFSRAPGPGASETGRSPSRWVLAFLGLWVSVQLLLPFRHLLVPGRVDWTEEGYYFSWRMMLNDKATAIRIVAIDEAGTRTPIDPRDWGLTRSQWDKLSQYPDLLVQFSKHVAEHIRENGGGRVAVRATVLASLNGRRPQFLVDPTVDLAAVSSYRVGHANWIVDLREPLPKEPWQQPPHTWEATVGPWRKSGNRR